MRIHAEPSHRSIWLGVVALVGLLMPAAASAQVSPGLRAGLSLDPDQFYVGGHIETDPLVERLVFRPSAEIGFGDNVTLAAFNFEFVRAGRPMAGRFYFLKATDKFVYVLRFTGFRDKLRSIRNQTDTIARTFNIAKK